MSRIHGALEGLPASVIHHGEWRRGIGSSLRVGVAQALVIAPQLESLLLLVCDQPSVTPEILRILLETRTNTHSRAAACAYGGSLGVPALFDRSFFTALQRLPDDQGAKTLLKTYQAEIAPVPFPQGTIDIDTPAARDTYLESLPS